MSLYHPRYDADYYEEHKAQGLDYAHYGDWQKAYGAWLAFALNWKGESILDVGCACGSIANGFSDAGCRVTGVDLCEPMIARGRQEFPRLDLRTCDSINLHLWAPSTFAGLHSAQVGEHWRPDYVPLIFRELARVAKPEALFFFCADTAESFARQGRAIGTPGEDPTHICIKPWPWWHQHAAAAGWHVDRAAIDSIKETPNPFLGRHDWEWAVWRLAK